ncbi:MAG: DNA repair protein RecN [Alphaproteobacteria bacterium]
MLQSLTIRNIAIIEQLHLEFNKGFSVFTGETGAGKSILLDSLGLVLGSRAQPTKIIREGQSEASVSLVLDPIPGAVLNLLTDHGFEPEAPLIIRRTLTAEGKSKAFLNDQPIGVGLLSQISPYLIEIHGQFDHLLNTTQQLEALDRYAGLSGEELNHDYRVWKEAEETLEVAEKNLSTKEFRLQDLTFQIQELEEVGVKAGEEEELVTLKETEKSTDLIQTILHQIDELSRDPLNLEGRFLAIQRSLQKLDIPNFSHLKQLIETALLSVQEIQEEAQHLASNLQHSSLSLDQIESRLYTIRKIARKYQKELSELPGFLLDLRQAHLALNNSDTSLEHLRHQASKAKEAYVQKAHHIYGLRQKAAQGLAQEMKRSLEPLKLPHAIFMVSFQELPDPQWSPKGQHKVEFYISTNPGISPGPLAKIASGGELSRVMLALKFILKEKTNIPTLIFDEIDVGLGGSVADAMGEQLAKLSQTCQVLAITHSPQLAAHADYHFGVSKIVIDGKTSTAIQTLETEGRVEELSRMLAGKNITEVSRAAAQELLKNKVYI